MSTKHAEARKVKPTHLQGPESSVQGMLDWELCVSLKANNDIRKFQEVFGRGFLRKEITFCPRIVHYFPWYVLVEPKDKTGFKYLLKSTLH